VHGCLAKNRVTEFCHLPDMNDKKATDAMTKSGAGFRRLTSPAAAMALVLIIGSLLLFPGLGSAPFDDPGEGMHAEIAHEIITTGDWITLHLNGVRYFDKPPVLYWLTALGMKAWGATEAAARFWPAAGALAAIAATALLGARLMTFEAGCTAGLALLTCLGFFAYARYLRPETLFVAAIQWGFVLWLFKFKRPRLMTVFSCAFFGLAALIKDPLGLMGPLAALAIALALSRQIEAAAQWLPWKRIMAVLTLCLLWYGLEEFRNRGFLWYAVVDNHLLNALHARHFPDEDVSLTTLEFLCAAGFGAFPWVLPAAVTAGSLLWRRAWQKPKEFPWVVLAVWTVGVLGLFALVRFKLPHYGLPVYPAIALLAARWWQEGKAQRTVLALHLAIFMAAALSCLWVYNSDGRAFQSLVFGTADVYTRKEEAIGQATPLPSWEALRSLIGLSAVIFSLCTYGLVAALVRRSRRLGMWAVILSMLALMPLAGHALGLFSTSRSVKAMAQQLKSSMDPGDLLIHEGPIEDTGALEFYSGRRPLILDGAVSVLGFGSLFPEARGMFWDRSRLKQAWAGPQRIFLVTIREPSNSVISELPASEVYPLAAGCGRWLYSNRAVQH